MPLSWSELALGPPHDHRTELRSVERQRVKNGIPLVWKIEVSRRACSWLLALKALLASAYLISLSIMCTRLRGFESLLLPPFAPLSRRSTFMLEKYFYFFLNRKFKLLFTLKKSRSSRANHNKYLSSFFLLLYMLSTDWSLELASKLQSVLCVSFFLRCCAIRRSSRSTLDVPLNLLNINYPALTRVSPQARFARKNTANLTWKFPPHLAIVARKSIEISIKFALSQTLWLSVCCCWR